MAINQISVFIYPPRWAQVLTEASNAIDDQENCMQIADTVRFVDIEVLPLLPSSVVNWLVEQGLTTADNTYFEFGSVRSGWGMEPESSFRLT